MAAVIEVENLVKRYKELVALDHFNLKIEEGESLDQMVLAKLQQLIVFYHY